MNDIHSLVHAYVVDALDPDETREFEQHLAGCAQCAQEVAELREVTSALSVQTAAEPPASLRSGVLDAISRTPQEPAESQERVDVPATVTPIAARVSGSRGRADDAPVDSRRGLPGRWSVGLVAASLVAAVGLGGWAIQTRQDLDETEREAQSVTAQTDQLARLLAADDVQLVRGAYTDGGSGVVVMSASEGSAMLIGRDLPALPDDRVYEAWTIDGEPAPAGTFTPESGQSVLELPGATFDAESLAVTVEPAGGSESPTSDPVFAVEVPQ
jgi:anti-sigma-K factor RskA